MDPVVSGRRDKMIPIIDAHLHLDQYNHKEREGLLVDAGSMNIKGLITVSTDLDSCKKNREIHMKYPNLVHPAYGYHPEQNLPNSSEKEQLIQWMISHSNEMVAVGEVGLPYYTRKEAEGKGEEFDYASYIALLEEFIILAKTLGKPIVLHAVYEDAEIACDFLEKHQVTQALFHWYKGPEEVTRRMAGRGYFISITPDVCYEEEIQKLVSMYPIERMMVETDGPWPFEGPFLGELTHPRMIRKSIEKIAEIKGVDPDVVALQILNNTKAFYHLG